MKRRTIPQTPIAYVKDSAQANAALGELLSLTRQLTSMADEANADIDRIKQVYEQKAAPLDKRKREIEAGLQAYAEFNRDLFATRKSIDFSYGRLGFRSSTKVEHKRGVTWEQVLSRLQELSQVEAIRTVQEVNKEVLASWPDTALEQIQCRRVVKDAFFYELEQVVPKGQ
jgi:phage host-nuclease inhibitor protein Gam